MNTNVSEEGKVVGKNGKVGIGLISMNVTEKLNNTNLKIYRKYGTLFSS